MNREQQRTRRTNAILDACAEALASKSEDDISIDEIATRAELSRATVFNYFATKRDIVIAIAEREIDGLIEFAESRSNEGSSPLDTISEVMYRLVGLSFSEPVVSWRVLRDLFDDPSRSDAPVWRLLDLIAGLIGKSIGTGELRRNLDPAGCARAIVGTYLAELFVLAGSTSAEPTDAPSKAPQREEFDGVAEQLISGWRAKPAVV